MNELSINFPYKYMQYERVQPNIKIVYGLFKHGTPCGKCYFYLQTLSFFNERVYHLNKNVLNQPCKMPVCKTVSKCMFNTCRAFILFGIAVWVATQNKTHQMVKLDVHNVYMY